MKLIPPDRLILANGIGHLENQNIAEDFNTIGRMRVADMIDTTKFNADCHILDVGCGLGRMARVLTEYLSPAGSYRGIDVTKSSIEWCQESYAAFKNFEFIHADVFSTRYNSNGKSVADNYRFPFENNKFDIIFSTSLFTHMRITGVNNYLAEMKRVAKLGARIYNTFFLLDEFSLKKAANYTLIDGGRVGSEHNPEDVTFHYTCRIKELHIMNGFELMDIKYGNWGGPNDHRNHILPRCSYWQERLDKKD